MIPTISCIVPVYNSEAYLGQALDSMVSSGSIISGGRVQRCVLSPNVRVNSWAVVEDSILLEGVDVRAELKRKGIIVRAQNPKLLAEEASEAYKDVANVVDVVQEAGLSCKVARMRPLAVIKG